MSTCKFHLLVNQHGERFIFYKNSLGEKIIENFSKIPYTAESLFDDIKDGFSAFPWAEDDWDNEYNENGVLVSMSIDNFTLGDEKVFRIRFKEIACVMIDDNAIYTELYTLQMNQEEKHLFGELKYFLEKYCSNEGIELCIGDESVEMVQ